MRFEHVLIHVIGLFPAARIGETHVEVTLENIANLNTIRLDSTAEY